MNILKVIDKRFEQVLCALILTVMVMAIFAQVILRYIGAPLSWTEELGRYLFVWLIYISCSLAVKERGHIKVDILKILLGKNGNFVLDLISNIMFLFFASAFTYYSWNAVSRLAFVRPQYSAALHMPMWVAYLSITVGCALMVIRLIQDTVRLIREHRCTNSDGNEKETLL